MRKYWGYLEMEWKRTRFYWQGVVARLVMIGLRLALPYTVFAALVATGKLGQSEVGYLVWAILIGQILTACDIRFSKKIKQEVRSGEIIVRLMDPANYVIAKMFNAAGYFVPSFALYCAILFPVMWWWKPQNLNMIWLLIGVIIGFLISNLTGLILGLLSFVIEENEGITLVAGKLFFIFGNQLIPVALMPERVQYLARLTPFYLALAGPIDLASGRLDLAWGIGGGLIYVGALWMGALGLLRIVERRLVVNG